MLIYCEQRLWHRGALNSQKSIKLLNKYASYPDWPKSPHTDRRHLSRSSKMKPMGSLYSICWVQHRNCCRSSHISRQSVWPWFLTPLRHPRSNLTVSIESPWLLSRKSFLGPNLVSIAVFEIFRIKGLWPWYITVQDHPKWSPWAVYIISVGFNIVTIPVLDVFHIKKYGLDFHPSVWRKAKSDGANQSPWVICISALGIQSRICHRFRDISSQNFDVDLLILVGLTPGPKSPKKEMTCYPPRSIILQNVSARSRKMSTRCALPKFFTFWPWG